MGVDQEIFLKNIFWYFTKIKLSLSVYKIAEWPYKWSMSFSLDLNKQAQRVKFPGKLKKLFHPKIFLNDSQVFSANLQKHLGVYLNDTLNFNLNTKEKMSKAMNE